MYSSSKGTHQTLCLRNSRDGCCENIINRKKKKKKSFSQMIFICNRGRGSIKKRKKKKIRRLERESFSFGVGTNASKKKYEEEEEEDLWNSYEFARLLFFETEEFYTYIFFFSIFQHTHTHTQKGSRFSLLVESFHDFWRFWQVDITHQEDSLLLPCPA